MRPDTDNFLFPLRRLSPPPPANSPPAKPAVGSDTLPEAGYARFTDENYPPVCVACFFPSPPYHSSPADIFFSESLHILAERLSQSEIVLPLRKVS